MLPINVALMIATFVQTFLYGVYITTLVSCLRCLLHNHDEGTLRRKFNWPMLTVSALVFVFSTIDLACMLETVTEVMLRIRSNVIGKLDTTNTFFEFSMILMIDAILIHRCWIVYAGSWLVVCIPIISWLAGVAFGIMVVTVKAILLVHPGKFSEVFASSIFAAFLACNIVTNIYATSAIIYRILRVSKGSIGSTTRLYNTCGIIAESGLLYTLSSILNLYGATRDVNEALLKLVADAINSSMAGIAFNLIVIRVYQQRTNNGLSYADPEKTVGRKPLSRLQFRATNATALSSMGPNEETDMSTP